MYTFQILILGVFQAQPCKNIRQRCEILKYTQLIKYFNSHSSIPQFALILFVNVLTMLLCYLCVHITPVILYKICADIFLIYPILTFR